MKNYGVVLIRETGDCGTSDWKVPANSINEAREKLLEFIRNDEGFQEFNTALHCSFPYRTNYVGFCDEYVESSCLEMTSENLKDDYQTYAWTCANWEYYGNHWRDTSLMKYCDKYGIKYKNKRFLIEPPAVEEPAEEKIKIELEVTKEEAEQIFYLFRKESNSYLDEMIDYESRGYPNGNDDMKAIYATRNKWFKAFKKFADEVAKHLSADD